MAMTDRSPTSARPSAAGRQRFPVAPPDKQVLAVSVSFLLIFFWFALRPLVDPNAGGSQGQQDQLVAALVAAIVVWRGLNAVRAYEIEPETPDGPQLVVQMWAPWRRQPVPLNRLVRLEPNPTVRGIITS